MEKGSRDKIVGRLGLTLPKHNSAAMGRGVAEGTLHVRGADLGAVLPLRSIFFFWLWKKTLKKPPEASKI